MENTLLATAFVALQPAEQREFGKFVRSPFFNQAHPPVALYDYLCACRAQNRKPVGAEAFQAMYPDVAYNDQKLRHANAALLALLEHYWAYQEKFSDAGRTRIRLAAAFRKRHLDKHFHIALREARQGREKLPYRHADFFHDLNLIEWEQYQFASAGRRADALNLQETSDLMDVAFVARKLRLACLARSHQALAPAEYSLSLLDAALDFARAHPEVPVLTLYFHCYKFLTDPAALEHFTRFSHLLLDHAVLFPPDEQRTLYLLALNFGIKKINDGSREWVQASFDLYKSALERDLLLENGRLSRFAFNNIVAIALRVGEAAWAESFIGQFKPRLERQYREASASLNLARVAFARKEYRQALLHLQRADYSDTLNNLTAKTLQLKIYYETREFDLLESHLASLQRFILRHTAIGYHRTNYNSIVQYTRLLTRLNPEDAVAVGQLRRRLEQETALSEKDWLLEQLDGTHS
jgi:hypothetical protein